MKPRRLLLPLLVAAAFSLGLWLPQDDDFFALRKNFQIFGALYEELVNGYVDPLDAERLMRTGLEAMLADLDPYTTFIDEADIANANIAAQGRYGDVGLNIDVRGEQFTVSSPIEGMSGYKQGVRAGDVILSVGGRPAAGMSLSDLLLLLRGEPGTAIEIRIQREGEPEPLSFLLTREPIQYKNVSFSSFVREDTVAGLGYVKLDRFGRDAGAEVRRAVQELLESGHLRGLVLDLRDNPGGLLDDAVEITQLFVPQGSVIVSTRGRLPQTERVYRSKMPPLMPDLPLTVLVNEYSASASEIVAGALQDLDRGVIIGTTTFGKGLVQIVRPLPYNTSLKLTTSRYFTPSGRSIQALDYGRHDGTSTAIPDSLRRTFRTAAGRAVRDGHGIEPDLMASPGAPSELEAALERRAAFFFFANHFAASNPEVPPGFTVSDKLYADFQSWLADRDFTYTTDAEHAVEALAESLDANGYAQAQDELAALRRAVAREKGDDFDRQGQRLRERLRAEILARYFGESALVVAGFAHDVQVRAALELLEDPAAYARLLR